MNSESRSQINPSAHAAPRPRRVVARVVAACSAVGLAAIGIAAVIEPWAETRALVIARGSGWLACGALLTSLCITPLSRLAERLTVAPRARRLAPVVRRALGMASAWLALLHAAVSLAGPLDLELLPLATWPHLRAGASALCVLLLLLATSYGSVVTRLRLTMFRELHRLAFVAAALVLQHALLSAYASRQLVLGVFGAALLFGLLRWLPTKGRLAHTEFK
ncbi:MAG: ferric reductase-like transmembrane domain-containing protein [Myxococcales bacterium]|nr:ferric reductase-like transmembrane domain-containing protein [Myxococcales bacterium]